MCTKELQENNFMIREACTGFIRHSVTSQMFRSTMNHDAVNMTIVIKFSPLSITVYSFTQSSIHDYRRMNEIASIRFDTVTEDCLDRVLAL